jgi:hypothetical protein
MKAYIKENITIKCSKEDLFYLDEYKLLFILKETELEEDWMCEVEIKEQKITLSEYDMNGIFDLFLYDTKIEYKNIGGFGDDFAINVYKK